MSRTRSTPGCAAPARSSGRPPPLPALLRPALLPIVLSLLGPVAPALAAGADTIKLLRSDVVVEPDGRAVQTVQIQIAVNNDAAARQDAQQRMSYTDGIDTVELVEGYTLKPDGRRIAVSRDAVRTQLAPGTPSIPLYADRKQVTAILPEVAGGDVLSVTWRRTILHPVFPGQFLYTGLFPRTAAWDDATISISLPPGMSLATETHGPAHTEADADGRHVHRWHWSAPAQARDVAAVSPLDRAPRLFASTIPDWATFGRLYTGMFAPQAAVTPRVQETADRIAAGAADRREEARRIYEWVSRHIRWVAVYVGNGDWVPHAAETVLTNGYGDCKDQVALLVALLRARGIAAEPVLVNLLPTYTLSGPPSLTAFNHMIAWLPEWGLYADTTAGGAPFGTVPLAEYGKPVLHLPAAGAAPDRMPVVPPDLATERLRTVMQLGADGTVTGDSVTEATGPYATQLRASANRILARGGERAIADWLQRTGLPGQGSFSPDAQDSMGSEYRVAAHFTLDAQPGWLDGDSFAMPSGIRALPHPGDGTLGPLALRALPAGEPTPCHAGRQEEDLSLQLPPGIRAVDLPKGRRIEDATFTYESRWSAEGGVVHVNRVLASRIDRPLCEGALRETAAKALAAIYRDQTAHIRLEHAETGE